MRFCSCGRLDVRSRPRPMMCGYKKQDRERHSHTTPYLHSYAFLQKLQSPTPPFQVRLCPPYTSYRQCCPYNRPFLRRPLFQPHRYQDYFFQPACVRSRTRKPTSYPGQLLARSKADPCRDTIAIDDVGALRRDAQKCSTAQTSSKGQRYYLRITNNMPAISLFSQFRSRFNSCWAA